MKRNPMLCEDPWGSIRLDIRAVIDLTRYRGAARKFADEFTLWWIDSEKLQYKEKFASAIKFGISTDLVSLS